MWGTKCPTVRSGGTISVRSALMPMVMMSRASMGFQSVIPGRCKASSPESRDSGSGPSDHPGMTTQWAFALRLLLRRRLAFHKSLAALHLVCQRGFVDLYDRRVRSGAEVLD